MNGKKCPKLKLLAFYIDDELPVQEMQKTRLHLSGCPHCYNRINELSLINTSLKKSLDDETLPLGFEQRFFKRLEESSGKTIFSFIPRFVWAGAVISVLFLFFISVNNETDISSAFNRISGTNNVKIEQRIMSDITNDALDYL